MAGNRVYKKEKIDLLEFTWLNGNICLNLLKIWKVYVWKYFLIQQNSHRIPFEWSIWVLSRNNDWRIAIIHFGNDGTMIKNTVERGTFQTSEQLGMHRGTLWMDEKHNLNLNF